MGLIKIESTAIETDIITRPDGIDGDKWTANISSYTGSTSHIAIMKWLAFVKHVSSESFTKKFEIPNVLVVDLSLSETKFELSSIINGLIKRGQYKKYAGVWNWIPELQEILLNDTWPKKRPSGREEEKRRMFSTRYSINPPRKQRPVNSAPTVSLDSWTSIAYPSTSSMINTLRTLHTQVISSYFDGSTVDVRSSSHPIHPDEAYGGSNAQEIQQTLDNLAPEISPEGTQEGFDPILRLKT